jgi:hypothetical protein
MHRMGSLVKKRRRAKGDKLKMQGALDIPTSVNSITESTAIILLIEIDEDILRAVSG